MLRWFENRLNPYPLDPPALVDLLTGHTPESFLAEEGWKLALMGVLLLVVMPALFLFDSLVIHQTLLGNLPMRIRWNVHRYLVRQSMSYFQDEFAGRIATKLMQTALAVRESVLKVLDVLNWKLFVGAYVVWSQTCCHGTLPRSACRTSYPVRAVRRRSRSACHLRSIENASLRPVRSIESGVKPNARWLR